MSTTIGCHHGYLVFHFVANIFNSLEDFFQIFAEMLFEVFKVRLPDVLSCETDAQSLVVDLYVSLAMQLHVELLRSISYEKSMCMGVDETWYNAVVGAVNDTVEVAILKLLLYCLGEPNAHNKTILIDNDGGI
jgi:hypothetical protein